MSKSSLISSIYKSREIILEQLEMQNYDVSNYKGIDINEINTLYETSMLDILVEKNTEDGQETKEETEMIKQKMYVHYYPDGKISQTKIQNLDYVAKVNKERTEIINLYLDRKTASRYNNYESSSALDTVVKNETIKDGYYYLLYHKCSETLRNNFVEKHGEPILYKNGIGQYDSQNNLVQEFVCKQYCVKTLNISDKSLSKALNKNMMYNNFYYKYMGVKDKY